eukprot:TRINITY_DN54819_c0_g1_i1.p1 TRINITY_DN54819_c0_g1~~TRINITY_DN54819_c0_g1_i1.p1  ORF type:complete len:700 (-),score=100.47 TRINITY_DN54819_c0_g1_i1:221-2263(-)
MVSAAFKGRQRASNTSSALVLEGQRCTKGGGSSHSRDRSHRNGGRNSVGALSTTTGDRRVGIGRDNGDRSGSQGKLSPIVALQGQWDAVGIGKVIVKGLTVEYEHWPNQAPELQPKSDGRIYLGTWYTRLGCDIDKARCPDSSELPQRLTWCMDDAPNASLEWRRVREKSVALSSTTGSHVARSTVSVRQTATTSRRASGNRPLSCGEPAAVVASSGIPASAATPPGPASPGLPTAPTSASSSVVIGAVASLRRIFGRGSSTTASSFRAPASLRDSGSDCVALSGPSPISNSKSSTEPATRPAAGALPSEAEVAITPLLAIGTPPPCSSVALVGPAESATIVGPAATAQREHVKPQSPWLAASPGIPALKRRRRTSSAPQPPKEPPPLSLMEAVMPARPPATPHEEDGLGTQLTTIPTALKRAGPCATKTSGGSKAALSVSAFASSGEVAALGSACLDPCHCDSIAVVFADEDPVPLEGRSRSAASSLPGSICCEIQPSSVAAPALLTEPRATQPIEISVGTPFALLPPWCTDAQAGKPLLDGTSGASPLVTEVVSNVDGNEVEERLETGVTSWFAGLDRSTIIRLRLGLQGGVPATCAACYVDLRTCTSGPEAAAFACDRCGVRGDEGNPADMLVCADGEAVNMIDPCFYASCTECAALPHSERLPRTRRAALGRPLAR